MNIVNVEQGTKEWLEARQLKATASRASVIVTNGKGLKSYAIEKLAEYYSRAEAPSFSNEDTERGNELEDMARTLYEFETGQDVKQVGFITYNDYIGCSPDGLVGDDGLAEYKCHKDTKFMGLLLGDEIEKDYYNQMQMQLLITGRKWCDYFAFNQNFEKNYFIKRFYPDEEVQKKLLEGFKTFEEYIKDGRKKMEGY